MRHQHRAPNRDERLVQVRGAGGTLRQIETRRAESPMQARAEDGATGTPDGFEGYASTFWVVDSYGTAIAPGAYTKTLQERGDKVLVLWQHNPDWVIGKSISAAQDGQGLKVQAAVSDTTYGRDALTLLRDDVPLGLSIGFRTIRERPATEDDPLRFGENTPAWITQDPTTAWVIEEIKLYEYSPVSFAANDEAAPTVVHAGSLDGLLAAALLEELRAGRVSPEQRALAAEIAAAYAAAPDPAPRAPRTEEEERADRAFIAAYLAREMGLSLEHLTCVA